MTTKTKTQPFNLADFFTVPAASKGKNLPLKKPDGTETEYHLTVIGADAPAAKQALLAATRIVRDERKDTMSEDEKMAISERAGLQFRVALVTGWNLPVDFSKEAVTDLLQNNPGLAQEIEQFSGDRSRFFASVLVA
jgi:hypothetical protein